MNLWLKSKDAIMVGILFSLQTNTVIRNSESSKVSLSVYLKISIVNQIQQWKAHMIGNQKDEGFKAT